MNSWRLWWLKTKSQSLPAFLPSLVIYTTRWFPCEVSLSRALMHSLHILLKLKVCMLRATVTHYYIQLHTYPACLPRTRHDQCSRFPHNTTATTRVMQQRQHNVGLVMTGGRFYGSQRPHLTLNWWQSRWIVAMWGGGEGRGVLCWEISFINCNITPWLDCACGQAGSGL